MTTIPVSGCVPGGQARRRAAFTLLEMILVLTIISLLLGSGVYVMVGVIQDGEIVKAKADIGAIETALARYKMTTGALPTTEQGLKALVEKPVVEPVPARWNVKLKADAIVDPWGVPYYYLNPAQRTEDGPDIWSGGPDGTGGTGGTDDDIASWQ